MTALLTSWLRTVVPACWAAAVSLLVVHGLLPAALTDAADHAADTVVVPVVLAVVYAGLRWAEAQPWMPSWATRLLLGSTSTPTYLPPTPSPPPPPPVVGP